MEASLNPFFKGVDEEDYAEYFGEKGMDTSSHMYAY